MLSTPLISCSIGDATVLETTSADAPGKVAFTTTVGGAISGYSVMGSARYEMAPTRVRMIAMTLAKIGRSTKKWENRMVAALVARRYGALAGAGRAGGSTTPSSALTFCPGRAR